MPLFQLWNFPTIPVRPVFPSKKKRHPAGAGIIACEFTVTCEPKTHCTWESRMKVNPRNMAGFLRRGFSMKKTRDVEAVGRESYKFTITLNARRVLLEKTHGIQKCWCDARFPSKKIRNPEAVGPVSYEFTVTVKAQFTWENTRNVRVGRARIFHGKTHESGGSGSSVANKFTVEMKPRRILHEKT